MPTCVVTPNFGRTSLLYQARRSDFSIILGNPEIVRVLDILSLASPEGSDRGAEDARAEAPEGRAAATGRLPEEDDLRVGCEASLRWRLRPLPSSSSLASMPTSSSSLGSISQRSTHLVLPCFDSRSIMRRDIASKSARIFSWSARTVSRPFLTLVTSVTKAVTCSVTLSCPTDTFLISSCWESNLVLSDCMSLISSDCSDCLVLLSFEEDIAAAKRGGKRVVLKRRKLTTRGPLA